MREFEAGIMMAIRFNETASQDLLRRPELVDYCSNGWLPIEQPGSGILASTSSGCEQPSRKGCCILRSDRITIEGKLVFDLAILESNLCWKI